MKYKAVLFDMDGTLLDTLSDMHAAVNHILACHGWQTRSREEVRAFVGNGARRLMERAVPPEVTGDALEAVLTEYRDWYQSHNCVATAPYPGIPALLRTLAAAGVRIAVVSNKPDATTRALAEKFFPGVLALGQREDVPPKPDPTLVRRALASGAVLTRPIEGASLVRTCHIVWHRNKYLSPSLKLLIGLIREE